MQDRKIIGPFKQILPLRNLPLRGALSDDSLEIIEDGGLILEAGKIVSLDNFEVLIKAHPHVEVEKIHTDKVLLPGFIDAHTHICFGGSRAKDYAMRVAGKTYLEIAQSGGGIWDTVTQTRKSSLEHLRDVTIERAQQLLKQGVTTIEVKSGYGLNLESELKMLKAIQLADERSIADLVPTCLAAHMLPKDFIGSEEEYLNWIINELLPEVKKNGLSNRIDIFIEESAFSIEKSRHFLEKIKSAGWDITVHADQFTPGSSQVALEFGAVSADHLESMAEEDIQAMAKSETVAVALPGASLGLGMKFTPARKILDAGGILAIATDWNPGSAPMGQLLTQAAILGAYEKLTVAETLAAITYRAAFALRLKNGQGTLTEGSIADMQAYSTPDYREILYLQGSLKPSLIWKKGKLI